MITITGKNNFVFIQTNDAIESAEFELDENTTIITNAEVAEEFSTQEDLITRIAQLDVAKFPVLPAIGELCKQNIVYRYGNDKAKCIQEHNRTHYSLEETPALWLIIPTVTQGYPIWKQPAGAHDSYQIGDRVHFPDADSPVYESLINANVWSPTAYPDGWLLIP